MCWSYLRPHWKLNSALVIEVRSQSEWILFNDIYVDGEYDAAILHSINQSPEAFVVLDLGANVGYFALRFAHLFRSKRGVKAFQGRLIGVEASARTYANHMKRIPRSGIEDVVAHYECHHAAIGRREGSASFVYGSSEMSSRVSSTVGADEIVTYLDLESVLPQNVPIRLIKCDIEGAELEFLRSYPELLASTDTVVIEFHQEVCDAEECRRLLRGAGLVHSRAAKQYQSLVVECFSRRPFGA